MWRFALLFFFYILLSKFLEPNCSELKNRNSIVFNTISNPTLNCSCENQNFCYSDPQNSSIIGKKFDCSSLKILKNLGFLNLGQNSSEDTGNSTRDPKNVIFVSATSNDHLKFTRKSIESIRKFFPNQKYILYSIGLDKSNSDKLLEDFENIEIRQFEFSKYPKYVANLLEYRWKPLIIGEVIREYSNVWWMDAHIILESKNLANMIYEERAKGVRLKSDIIFTIRASHSNFAVLHPKLLEYFPHSSISLLKKSAQLGANFIYLARTRESLETLKWWILCALDAKCMNPDGAKLKCSFDKNRDDVYANCFRYDQSVVNLLLLNQFQDHRKYLSTHGFANSHY